RILWRVQPAMIWSSFHCFLTVAVLSESLSGSGAIRIRSGLELGQIDPAPLGPALQAELDELDALRRFEQVPLEVALAPDVFEEEFPLDLERVVERRAVG